MSNDIIAVVGMRDQGKTTWLRNNIAEEDNLIVIDTLGDHTFGSKGKPGWLPVPDKRDNLQDVLDEIEIAAKQGFFQIGIPMPIDDEEKAIWFEYLCLEAYQTAEHHTKCTLVVEEMGLYTNTQQTPAGLNAIIQYGAHAGVNLIWTARNPAEVSRRLTSETNMYVLFALHEPRWVEALGERLTDDIAQRVTQLEPGHYLMVDRVGNVVKDAKLWP